MPARDAPVNRLVAAYADALRIATHPAFRIGFLDAQAGKPIDHFRILDRIVSETPPTALNRLGWGHSLLDRPDAALAEYRYEEGRLVQLMYGLRCRSWRHPDYLPAAVMGWIEQKFPRETPQRSAA